MKRQLIRHFKMIPIGHGPREKPCGFARLVFLTIGMTFCCVGIIYYVSLKGASHVFGEIVFSTPNEKFHKVIRIQDSSSAADASVPIEPYDLTTYGLKVFKCNSQNPMASPKYSKVQFSYNEYENIYIVLVILFDSKNVRMNSGGDVIVMWAEQAGSDGRVAGTITDNLNGTYSGSFKIYWTGKTHIKVKIASTIQNQCLRSNALFRYGNTVYAKQVGWGIHADYQSKQNKYQTKCGANSYIYLSPNLCNFTTINANFPWFCGAPPSTSSLTCSHIDHFTIGPFDTTSIPANEKMTDLGHGILEKVVDIDVKQKRETDKSYKCFNYPKNLTWTNTQPSGYWAGGRWNFIHCDNNAISLSYASYRQCLRGKYLAVIGDSTVRQISEFFLRDVLNLGRIDLKDGLGIGTGPNRAYQVHKEFKAYNITTSYSKHEFPFHNINFPPNNITSMPLELQRMESKNIPGKDLIVLLHYNQHFHAYPIEEFHLRIRRLVPAVKKLLKSKPGVQILFKGPHMTIDDVRWFDPRISLIYMDILHKEFQEIRDHVTYLDTWSITVAHNSELPHPEGNAFVSQIHQMMSYICTY